jgi:hypothetical protein
MQSPPARVSVGRILRASRRVLARLKRNPKAKSLAAKLQAPHDALKNANLALTEADDQAEDAGAAVDECDALAREAVVDFQMNLVTAVRRDYTSPEYIAVFPEGLEKVKRHGGAELRKDVQAIVKHISKLAQDSPLHAQTKPLQACVDAYGPALQSEEHALALLAEAETTLAVARAKWLLVYDGLAGDVRSLFPGRRSFVESFFPQWSQKAAKKTGLRGADDRKKEQNAEE